ncbi:unnamed protein product [Somion occarium]|uniref:F-box domain-containing protein n=1 Tax=Somion occarium TaxID=3059160 RepID=A0ABP1D6I0_9APHY
MHPLPIEIIELVIDFCAAYPTSFGNAEELHEDRRETLRACALTCKTWLPRSRFNLFRHVEISPEHSSGILLDTLRTNPHCASNVRVLEVLDPLFSSGFVLLAERLPRLEWLHLYCKDAHRNNFFFMSMTQFSSITFLTLSLPWSATHIMRLLACFPHLTYLNCGPDFCKAPISHPVSHYKPTFSLACIVLNLVSSVDFSSDDGPKPFYLYSILPRLAPAVFSCLRVCVLILPDIRSAALKTNDWLLPLLAVAGPSIHELDLDFWSIEENPVAANDSSIFISLRHNMNLRRLCVRLKESNAINILDLYELLSTVVSTALVHIDICITSLTRSANEDVDHTFWQALDNLLKQRRFRSLHTFNIVCNDHDRRILEKTLSSVKLNMNRILTICGPFEPPRWTRLHGH